MNLIKTDTTPRECRDMRMKYREGVPIQFIADGLDKSTETVRRHLKGECQCDKKASPINYREFRADKLGCPDCPETFDSWRKLQKHLYEP